MNMMINSTRFARSHGDPRVIEAGPSSRGASDNIGKALGWFSIGLGMAELLAARRIAAKLGMEGNESLLRAYGVREILAGVTCLSTETQVGVWTRVAGDAIDAATLLPYLRASNRKRGNVTAALAIVAGAALIDITTAVALGRRHARGDSDPRDYSDRSGFPHGIEAARGSAVGLLERDGMGSRSAPGSADDADRSSPARSATKPMAPA